MHYLPLGFSLRCKQAFFLPLPFYSCTVSDHPPVADIEESELHHCGQAATMTKWRKERRMPLSPTIHWRARIKALLQTCAIFDKSRRFPDGQNDHQAVDGVLPSGTETASFELKNITTCGAAIEYPTGVTLSLTTVALSLLVFLGAPTTRLEAYP